MRGMGVSPLGRYSTPYPLWDGTGRALVVFTPSQPVQTTNAVGQPVTVEGTPRYGIYMLDLNARTLRPVVLPQDGYYYSDPVAIQARPTPQVKSNFTPDPTIGAGLGLFDVNTVYDTDNLQRMGDAVLASGESIPRAGGVPDIANLLLVQLVETRSCPPRQFATAALNLLRLAEITNRAGWREKADRIFAVSRRTLQEWPEAVPLLAAALDFSLTKPKQIIIAGVHNSPDTRALLRPVYERFLPAKVLLLVDCDQTRKRLTQWLPFILGMTAIEGKATAYICENYTCKLPTSDPQQVVRLLEGKP